MADMFGDDQMLGDFDERESDALDFLYNDVGGDGNLFQESDYLEQHDQESGSAVSAGGGIHARESSERTATAPKRKPSAKQAALTSSLSAGKSTKRKSLKKAPNAPVRFKNPYIFFVQKHMALLRSVPMSVPEKMSQLAFEWATLTADQKAEFERSADLDKARYFNEMRNYDGPSHVPNKRPKKPPVCTPPVLSPFPSLSLSSSLRPLLTSMPHTSFSTGRPETLNVGIFQLFTSNAAQTAPRVSSSQNHRAQQSLGAALEGR